VSPIATATSTAVEAAIPTISVRCAVATARSASAINPRSRERVTYPSAPRRKRLWASRKSADQAGGLDHTNVDALNRFLRRQLHNRDGYGQPLDLVLERLVA